MKKALMAAALLVGGGLEVQAPAWAHGGTFRGPGDTVPPGGGGPNGGGGAGPSGGPSGPSTPGPTGPTAPVPGIPGVPGKTGAQPTTGGPAELPPDLTQWSFWWEFNKDPYLDLKSRIHAAAGLTGSDGFWLGSGQRRAVDSRAPTEQQIRGTVVPALLAALEQEPHNDIVTGCLIALAKIGDVEESDSGSSALEGVFVRWLAARNQEISETAAIALGILANPASIPTLRELFLDTKGGRALVGRSEVNFRTRAFAGYGLGLVGAAAGSEEDRRTIVRALWRALENPDESFHDVRVAAIVSLGLVPLATLEAPGDESPATSPASRQQVLDGLLAFFEDEQRNPFARAHCPTAMARLLRDLPPGALGSYRGRIARSLLARFHASANEPNEIVQSAVQALGQIGTSDGLDPLDRDIRKALTRSKLRNQQARYFSLIATAQVGGRRGKEDPEVGTAEAASFLLTQLARGKGETGPWAALAIGVLGRELAEGVDADPLIGTLQDAVRTALLEEKTPLRIAAYALAAGLLKDVEAEEALRHHYRRLRDDEARGYVAVALGLLGSRDAIDDIERVVRDTQARAELLRQSAVALGLMGDVTVVDTLVDKLKTARTLATQAAVAQALGFIGDQRSIEPLVEMLGDRQLPAIARGLAAAALGIVAEKERLPWNSKLARDLNYRAATETLTDGQTGVLDLL